jgi:hypothetical protein
MVPLLPLLIKTKLTPKKAMGPRGADHIDLLRRWPSRMTRFEFPDLFPAGRFLCSEHGENHLVAYIDGVRYDQGLPPKAWYITRTWTLKRLESLAGRPSLNPRSAPSTRPRRCHLDERPAP